MPFPNNGGRLLAELRLCRVVELQNRTDDCFVKGFWNRRQHFAAVTSDEDVVFNSYSATAGQIDSRFHGHHHSRTKNFVCNRTKPRRFVYLKTETVTETVPEITTKSGSIDDFPSHRINVLAPDARTNRSNGGKLRF